VFADAGLPVDRRYADGVYDLSFPLPVTALPADDEGTALDAYLSAVAERERRAEAASLRHVLAPESVVVIGVSRRPGTAGGAILDNIRAGGYAGRLYVVNSHAREIAGERCLASALDLPAPADLAVIAGPAGFGVAVPAIGLNATVAARPPRPGVAGLVMQSGGLGFALVDQLSRLGI